MIKKVLRLFASASLLVTGALAQTSAPAAAYPKMEFFQRVAPEPEGAINFLFTELANGGEVVKGAPYSATAISETTQVLADGNRIVNKSSTLVARDGEGRTRREQTIGSVGPLQVDGGRVIFISDPVAKTDYVLNPDHQTARIMKVERTLASGIEERQRLPEKILAEEHQKLMVEKALVAERQKQGEKTVVAIPESRRGNLKTESLGTQVIEGVSCEGQRTTRTVPAGAIGNERPLETIVETWTSPELHALVLKKHSDPRFGETVYRLTDIKRGEPDASMFQVPSGYSTEKSMPRRVIALPKD